MAWDKFAGQVKYLGILLHTSLKDDSEIWRKVKMLDCAANKLKSVLDQRSTAVKNTLLHDYCMLMYA